ncbi:hypothetical protein CYMTET_37293 [Cymbomonas tetramitiformis]|uniref:Uncharacterized protein n=1 Tax=Cymbomonas tetramitiformis TaxID=36881 RepID=A0AAE0CFJ9_9CHLO|nr:hypothetical protein CYMTET_37293 [Cymbomonas tetramitiformis]
MINGLPKRCDRKPCGGGCFCMPEHQQETCEVVATIPSGADAFCQQCDRLQKSDDEEVYEKILDYLCYEVVMKCHLASTAADKEDAFMNIDVSNFVTDLDSECREFLSSLKESRALFRVQHSAQQHTLSSMLADMTLTSEPEQSARQSPIRIPRSRQTSHQGTPIVSQSNVPSAAPSVCEFKDTPNMAAKILTLERVSELEAEVESLKSEKEQSRMRITELEHEVTTLKTQNNALFAEVESHKGELTSAPGPSQPAAKSYVTKKQLESQLKAALKRSNELEAQVSVLSEELNDIEELESLLDPPLNSAGYDWSTDRNCGPKIRAAVYLFDIEYESSDASQPLATTNDAKDKLTF